MPPLNMVLSELVVKAPSYPPEIVTVLFISIKRFSVNDSAMTFMISPSDAASYFQLSFLVQCVYHYPLHVPILYTVHRRFPELPDLLPHH